LQAAQRFVRFANVTKRLKTRQTLRNVCKALLLQPATVFVGVQTFVVGGKVCTTTKIVAVKPYETLRLQPATRRPIGDGLQVAGATFRNVS
jgi:hypothetical protein